MIAARPASPWKLLAVALAGAAAVLAWRARPVERAPSQPVSLHVKLRAEGARPAAASGQVSSLFLHLPAGTHDDRARWIQIAVPAGEVEGALAALAADPAVEQ